MVIFRYSHLLFIFNHLGLEFQYILISRQTNKRLVTICCLVLENCLMVMSIYHSKLHVQIYIVLDISFTCTQWRTQEISHEGALCKKYIKL